MKKTILSGCRSLLIVLAASAAMAFPAAAAVIHGEIDQVDSDSISGWAWNKEDTNDVQSVEVHIFQSGKAEPVKYLHASADDYQEDLVADLKDGWHGFSVDVDWSQFEGDRFQIKAYAVKDEKYYTLGETVSYTKGSAAEGATSKTEQATADEKSSEQAQAPAVEKPSEPVQIPAEEKPSVAAQTAASGSETSLGLFTTSGYCNCLQCNANGHALTYSGTVPQADHTISADLSLLPIGSRVRIGDVIYTVEDIGGHVAGNWIDIYYADHDSAMAHGLKQQEVFLLP